MKISIMTLGFALALGACGSDDHDDLDHVVWSATTPPGSSAEIDDRGALILAMGGPDFCPAAPCGPVALVTELPEGDFQLRFEGVTLENVGEIGAYLAVDEYYVNTRFNHWGDGNQGVTIDVLGEAQYASTGIGFYGDEPVESEFTLIREGGRLTGWAKYATDEVTEFADVGSGPAELTVYLEPEEDVAPTDTLAATIARRAVSTEVTSFADDVIE